MRKATVNKNIRTLKSSLNRAVELGYLLKNPVSNVKQLREPERKVRVLRGMEIERLLVACHSIRWKAFVTLALFTGMRLSELTALRWEDVDFQRKTVWVVNTPGHQTKSKKNRTLGLMDKPAAILKQLPNNGPHVFQTQDGDKWKNNIQRGFIAIVKKAGIKYCTIHDLRRTFITHLAESGVSAIVVKELAGHDSIETTLKYYTNISSAVQRSAQEKLSDALMGGNEKIIPYSSLDAKSEMDGPEGKIVNFDNIAGYRTVRR